MASEDVKDLEIFNGTATYTGTIRNGKPDGTGTLTYENGDKYEGTFEDGEPETGTLTRKNGGTLTYKNGHKYEGTFFEDGKYKEGTLTLKYGFIYEGTFAGGKYEKGTLTYKTLDKYKGYFKVSEKDGLPVPGKIKFYSGTYRYEANDRSILEGTMKEGKKHGILTRTYITGDKLTIEFKDGIEVKKDGTLIHQYPKGYITITFKDGIQDKIKKFKFFNNDIYLGEAVDDKPHGKGTYTFANGNKYEGDFTDGKPHGKGTYTFINGNKYEGDFIDGAINGKGYYTFANGLEYEVYFKDGEPNGKGTYKYRNGDELTIEFKDGVPSGKGSYTFANGTTYEVEVDKNNGKPSGKGTHKDPNGDESTIEFKDGVRNGTETLTYKKAGYTQENVMKAGKLDSITQIYPNGDRLKITFTQDGTPNPKGTLTCARFHYTKDGKLINTTPIGDKTPIGGNYGPREYVREVTVVADKSGGFIYIEIEPNKNKVSTDPNKEQGFTAGPKKRYANLKRTPRGNSNLKRTPRDNSNLKRTPRDNSKLTKNQHFL